MRVSGRLHRGEALNRDALALVPALNPQLRMCRLSRSRHRVDAGADGGSRSSWSSACGIRCHGLDTALLADLLAAGLSPSATSSSSTLQTAPLLLPTAAPGRRAASVLLLAASCLPRATSKLSPSCKDDR